MAFPHPRRPDKDRIPLFFNKMAARQFVHLPPIDAGVKTEVEAFQRAALPEAGRALTPGKLSLMTHVEFVLKHQLQELGGAELVVLRFSKAQRQVR
jgi:hypothetical protein